MPHILSPERLFIPLNPQRDTPPYFQRRLAAVDLTPTSKLATEFRALLQGVRSEPRPIPDAIHGVQNLESSGRSGNKVIRSRPRNFWVTQRSGHLVGAAL